MKNNLLYDFMKIYYKLECKGSCHNCPNKKICNSLDNVIDSIIDLYKEE